MERLPFKYCFNGSPFGTIKEWPNLIPGTYTYVVKDAKTIRYQVVFKLLNLKY
ncbi:MAG: hypothetical protein IPO92_11705 [Saprospiraceae bacterium]|nr:hypothetical protein [Saprospiraceae bacterium]